MVKYNRLIPIAKLNLETQNAILCVLLLKQFSPIFDPRWILMDKIKIVKRQFFSIYFRAADMISKFRIKRTRHHNNTVISKKPIYKISCWEDALD